MAEYIELIDKYRIVQSEDTDYNPPSYDWVDNTGEIVRCKDCIFRSNEWTGCPKLNGTITGDEFFCKCGIKREES